jgi:hypothetical protein
MRKLHAEPILAMEETEPSVERVRLADVPKRDGPSSRTRRTPRRADPNDGGSTTLVALAIARALGQNDSFDEHAAITTYLGQSINIK